jgi:hypothetical protein
MKFPFQSPLGNLLPADDMNLSDKLKFVSIEIAILIK